MLMYACFLQVSLPTSTTKNEDKTLFFLENDENQDQVLIHLSFLNRVGTQRSTVNNHSPVKTAQERKWRGGKQLVRIKFP